MAELHIEIIERLTRMETLQLNTLEQAKKTNGRMDKAEDRLTSLEFTRAENKGGWKVAGITAGAVSTAVYFILGKIIS